MLIIKVIFAELPINNIMQRKCFKIGVLEILCHSSNIKSKRNNIRPNPLIATKPLGLPGLAML